jgi:hypothetical protein
MRCNGADDEAQPSPDDASSIGKREDRSAGSSRECGSTCFKFATSSGRSRNAVSEVGHDTFEVVDELIVRQLLATGRRRVE